MSVPGGSAPTGPPGATPAALPGDQCAVHRYHWPPVRETERHHVQPLSMGGPDTPANIVKICPTGHANIHVALRDLVHLRVPKGTREERRLAQVGFTRWVQAGRPGRAP